MAAPPVQPALQAAAAQAPEVPGSRASGDLDDNDDGDDVDEEGDGDNNNIMTIIKFPTGFECWSERMRMTNRMMMATIS